MNQDNYEDAMRAPIQRDSHELPITMHGEEMTEPLVGIFGALAIVGGCFVVALILFFLVWAFGLHRVLF